MYTERTHCRACGLGRPSLSTLKHSTAAGTPITEDKLIEVLDLGLMPLANDFVENGGERSGYAPLKLMWCPRCTLAQLSVVVNPNILYRNYPYVTSHSATMNDHFGLLVTDLLKECAGKSVVEIGSNDGTLLAHCKLRGFETVLGVEPAENLCAMAAKNGIQTFNQFFNKHSATRIITEIGDPDLVLARHVFCHIDNWRETINALEMICAKNTVIAIEVPYFPDTVAKVEWDQIYHEHLSYLTIRSMDHALKGTSLHIHSVKHYSIHGGAVVVMLKRNDNQIPNVEMDNVTISDMNLFRGKVKDLIHNLIVTVNELLAQGATVVGYGASAKATQWIKQCGFTRNQIKWVCDSTPDKQYKLMPGSDIPVVDEGALTRDLPDYAINFAWNFQKEIFDKEKVFRKYGGKWIVPVPEVKIV